MQTSEAQSAVGAAISVASALGLRADNAVVLQDSNRLTLRLLPCDTVARVAPIAYQASAEFEVAIARRLAASGSPAAALEPRAEPRVYVQDGFAINMWTYYEPASPHAIAPAEYARALARLHAGLREIDIPAPHFTDRVAEAQRIVDIPAQSPDLAAVDRAFLSGTLRELKQTVGQRGAAEQLLHGEPHPGNLLRTTSRPLFIDFETCCRGPIEFDIADAPEEVGEHYPGLDQDLLGECRVLALALVAAWRWDRDDSFPNGRQMGIELLSQIRAARPNSGVVQ